MIDSELSADRQRGPGFGRLRIANSRLDAAGLRFALMRNQGNTPFLGDGGTWQATEVWHPAEAVAGDDGASVIAVGPDVVDAIVAQPANVAFRLMLSADDGREVGTLRIVQPLYGSSAAGGTEAAQLEQQQREAAEEEARRRAEEDEARRRQAEQEEEDRLRREAEAARLAAAAEAATPVEETAQADSGDAEPRSRGNRTGLIVAAVALLALAGGGAGAWFSCLIPGFGPESCGAPVPPPAPVELTCAGLTSGSDCYAVAEQALSQKKLEPARQLFQQAASLGSVEANIAVARMYDPKTWSAEASPVASANWETAVFWYEKAASHGDRVAQREAGRLLCANAGTGFEKRQGRAHLEKAAAAGDAEAGALIATCGE